MQEKRGKKEGEKKAKKEKWRKRNNPKRKEEIKSKVAVTKAAEVPIIGGMGDATHMHEIGGKAGAARGVRAGPGGGSHCRKKWVINRVPLP